MPKVLNIHNILPPNTVIVDRTSIWGNPFRITPTRTREQVCKLFEQYAIERLKREPDWLLPLKGMNLACHCAPLQCHAETLLRLANNP